MCGICGFTRKNRYTPDQVIDGMKERLARRGPDAHGSYADEQVVMGHRRLSVIDLESGAQPMPNETGTLWLVANGEIYNHQKLRQELESDGHRFSSRSDSEVLLHLYESHGLSMVDRIEGMYAFAIWDAACERLLLVRDRYGQKPLYYAHLDGQLVFASELKSILEYPGMDRRINMAALKQYLAYEYVPEPLSIFEGVHKLEAGSYLIWQHETIRKTKYWDFPVDVPQYSGSLENCCAELLSLFEASVEKRLMSDVPLGIFLSGGLDSSLITALACRLVTDRKLRTFSIGFEEQSFDETPYADRVSRHLSTTHVNETLSERQMVNLLPEIACIFDEPFADASAIPTYMVSRLARQQVTVVLSGDGGDELFAGYDPFQAHQISKWVEKLPKKINDRIFRRIVKLLTPSDDNMSFEFRVNKFFRYLYHPPVLKNQLWLGCFDSEMQAKCLLNKDDRQDAYIGLGPLIEATSTLDPIQSVIYAYIKTYMRDGILTKVDRASMAHGLEVRSPFLDSAMSKFIASIPPDWKLKGLTTKFILKKCAGSLLPRDIIHRKKKGFGIPKAKWLRGALREALSDSFSKSYLVRQGLFDYTYVQSLLNEHLTRKKDRQKELWTLFMFDQWYRNYMSP